MRKLLLASWVITWTALCLSCSPRNNPPPSQGTTSGDPLGFVLSAEQEAEGARLLREVFGPYIGKWEGTRVGKDTGQEDPVTLTKDYHSLVEGGPLLVADVKASIPGESVAVFAAAKAYAYDPARNTLLTYFFEGPGHVQIFALNRDAMSEGRLEWDEIGRSGQLFRAVETFPENGAFTSTIYKQDENGEYQVFAENSLRRTLQ